MRLQAINTELGRLSKETDEEGIDNSAKEMYYIGVIVRMLLIFDPVAADLSRMETSTKSNDGIGRQWSYNPHLGLSPSWLESQTQDLIMLEQADFDDFDNEGTNQEEEEETVTHTTGLEALATPEGVLDFSSGIVYGTGLVTNTFYLDICTNMLDVNFVVKGRQLYNSTLEIEIFPSLYNIYDIAWAIHPLFVNCYKAPHTA